MDQLFTVQQILNKCWEFDRDVYQLFVNFHQAYASILRDKLCDLEYARIWNTTKTGQSNKYDHDRDTRVRIQNEFTEPFELTQGLKQSDGLSPLLIDLSLEYVIRKMSVYRSRELYYKSVQVAAYADNKAIIT